MSILGLIMMFVSLTTGEPVLFVAGVVLLLLTPSRGEEDMCLGVPGKVLEVDGLVAVVDFWGLRRPILLDLADEPVRPGDYILNHVGFAIRRIPPEDVAETLALYEQLLNETADDIMAADVRGEIRAATDVTDDAAG